MLEILECRWNLPVSRMDRGFCQGLVPWFCRILLQAQYGFSQAKTVGNIVSDNKIKDSVLSMMLADEMAQIIRDKRGIVINEYSIQLLAVRFFRLINSIPYSYIPRRLLLCARNGKESARVIADSLKKHLGAEWIGKLVISGLYEGRKYPSEEYDCVIGSFSSYAYRYVWPYIEVGQIPQPEDYERIRREVVRKGYDLETVKNRCRWDTVWVHKEFSVGQMEGIFQLIAYQWGKSPADKERLALLFSEKRIVRAHSHMLTLMVPVSGTGQRIFELFLLKKSVVYMDKPVKSVVFISVDFDGDPEILRFTEQILRKLSTDMEVLAGSADSGNLMDILTERIREEL